MHTRVVQNDKTSRDIAKNTSYQNNRINRSHHDSECEIFGTRSEVLF